MVSRKETLSQSEVLRCGAVRTAGGFVPGARASPVSTPVLGTPFDRASSQDPRIDPVRVLRGIGREACDVPDAITP